MKTPIGTEVFSGFGISYPEHEIVTPQGLKHFTVRTLTVSEEEVLKGSMLAPGTIAQHISEVLWKCIVKKPDDIKTYDDFIKKTTLKDRDALIIGLHIATYGDIDKYSVDCPDCGFSNEVAINIENSMSYLLWSDESVSFVDRRLDVPLQIFKGVTAVLKTPTIADEIETNKKTQHMSDQMSRLMMELLMIDKFKVDPSEKNPDGDEITDRQNILAAYNSLPSRDKSLISKTYREEFNKYQLQIKAVVKCRGCGREIDTSVDMTQQFFRSLYQ